MQERNIHLCVLLLECILTELLASWLRLLVASCCVVGGCDMGTGPLMVAPVNVLCSDLLFSHLALTFFLQNGRIKGDQKKAIRAVLEKYGMPLTLTMNQVSALLHCCHCYRIPPPPSLATVASSSVPCGHDPQRPTARTMFVLCGLLP